MRFEQSGVVTSTHHADERGARCICYRLSHHGLPCPRGSVHENASGRVDPDLFVELEVGQRELNRLFDLTR